MFMKIKFISPVIFLLTSSVVVFSQSIEDKSKWKLCGQITSTNECRWNEGILNRSAKDKSYYKLVIKLDEARQTIDGFGGCFNEMGAKVLFELDESDRNIILKELFDPESGCGFNICRMPLGANDYSLDWYSYNETPLDFEMTDFSIDHDEKYLIPYIKAAQNIKPDLKIWASPWSPPSWMKINNHYACRSWQKYNDLKEEMQGKELTTMFIMKDEYLNSYAEYFAKFITGYSERGIDIYAVHIQNEPNSCQIFPSCIWAPEDLGIFIGKYLGPKFRNDNIKSEIWLGTIERPQIERVRQALENDARKYIIGIGLQWAGKDAIRLIHELYPELKLMQTETECGDGSNDWTAMEYTFDLVRHYFMNGANSYMYWNMILETNGISRWGWKQNSMISVDPKLKTIYFNPEFYLMKQLGQTVKPGYKYLSIDDKVNNLIAFKGDDRIILTILNKAGEKNLKIEIDGEILNVFIAANSLSSLEFKYD